MVKRFEKFSFYITETAKLIYKIEEAEMESLGLKGPHAIYLIAIARSNGGITGARLAAETGRDKADVSRAISAMEEKGLVKKSDDAKKNYRAPIVLTEAGKDATNRLQKKAMKAVEFGSHDVPDEDLKVFYRVLESILSNIRTMSESGVPGSCD